MDEVKIVAVGSCERCGKEFVRPPECDCAACNCSSAVLIPLDPALILPTRMYNKFQKIAEQAGTSVEKCVNCLLEVAFKNWERRKAVAI
jgi:hypothetical protein